MDTIVKIVHIISNLSIGGAQILLYDIIAYLNKKEDIDICVITIDSGENIKKYEDAGINVIDIKEKGLINPKIFFKLTKILREIKPDIIHTHLNKADFYGRIAAKQAGVPTIFSTCHNYSTTHKGADINKKSFFDVIDNFVIKYSNCNLIAISNLVKQYLINRNKSFEKITEVIYNGVDVEKEKYLLNDENKISEFRNNIKLRKSDFVISIIGRLEKQKGHLFFLNSIKDFIDEYKNVKVLMLGDGSLKDEVENFIRTNSIEDKVKIFGFIPDSEPFIEMSDLICVPSLWEGFGLVIIEAMIKKKIVLASNVGGIPEIITDDETGFLFESQNKKSLIEKLSYIYEHFNELDFIRENSLKLVKEKFDIKKNSELYYQLYLNVINKSKGKS